MIRIPRKDHECIDEDLGKIETIRIAIINSRKSQLNFLGYITRKKDIENLIFSYIEGKTDKYSE